MNKSHPSVAHLLANSRNWRYSADPFSAADGATRSANCTVCPAARGLPTSHVTSFWFRSESVHRVSESCGATRSVKTLCAMKVQN